MRQELRLSVVTVLGLLVLAAYCGAQPAAKINVLMEVSRKADLEKDWASDRGASFEYTANPGGRVRRTGWAKLTFPARKESEVLFSLPRPAFKRDVWSTYLKIPAEKNIWSGYQTLKVLCYNPSPQATEVGLLLEDLTGLIVGMVPAQDETLRGQMHRATVEVPPGESTISVAIDGKLRTRDDRRWLDIRHVRRVGFNVKGGGAGTVLYVKKLSLESSDKDAGTIAWPSEAKPCPTCAKGADKLEPYYAELGAKGFNDPNAK